MFKIQGMRVFVGGQIDLHLVGLDYGLQLIVVWTQSDFKRIGGEPTLRQSTRKHSVHFCKCKYSVHVKNNHCNPTKHGSTRHIPLVYISKISACPCTCLLYHNNRVKLHEVVYRNSPKLCHVLKMSVSDITIGFNKYKHVYNIL